MQNPIDEAARQLLIDKLSALEDYLNADVIVYYGEIFASVEVTIKQIVEDLQSEEPANKKMLYPSYNSRWQFKPC